MSDTFRRDPLLIRDYEFVSSTDAPGVAPGPGLMAELTFRPVANVDLALASVTELIEALSACEAVLGGAGMTWDQDQTFIRHGKLYLMLVPRTCDAGLDERIGELAEILNSAVTKATDGSDARQRVVAAVQAVEGGYYEEVRGMPLSTVP